MVFINVTGGIFAHHSAYSSPGNHSFPYYSGSGTVQEFGDEDMLDWIDGSRFVDITSDQSVEIEDIRTTGKLYRLSINANEHFYVANHQGTGFDQLYKGSGLLIWHIKPYGLLWDIECADGKFTSGYPDPVSGTDLLDQLIALPGRRKFRGVNELGLIDETTWLQIGSNN